MDFSQQLFALGQIIFIDLVLAGDNAIVVGLAASRVSPELRARVIFWGMAGAVLLRVSFAAVATQLLTIVGLTLAGGILLLWVCWKMYREIALAAPMPAMAGGGSLPDSPAPPMAFKAALFQIILADVSMSLDNVLAVAGAARAISRYIFQHTHSSRMPPASVRPTIVSNWVATAANVTRRITAPAMPQKMTRARSSGDTREAARPTTIALSPANTRSMKMICPRAKSC